MKNQYAVFQKQDGSFFFNPNCYQTNVASVGDVVDGVKCVLVCSLSEAEQFCAKHNPPAKDFFKDLLK